MFGACGPTKQAEFSQEVSKGSAEAPTNQISPVINNAVAESRHLGLFGTTGAARDLSFVGKAATDLRQHTTISEGADFDPEVDSRGELLVFASTRHSPHSHLYVKGVNGATLTQVTDETADDTQPSFSPDATRIAFASNRSGQWDIWVIGVDGRNPVQMTNTLASELHPSWSPDGKNLVYCRIDPKTDRGELWVVDVANPATRRFLGEGLFPEWSPRGDKIVYQRARSRGSRWFSLWTLDVNLAKDEVLYPTEVASSADAALIAPAWSPDGTRIAFTALSSVEQAVPARPTTSSRASLGVVDADGRGLARLTDGYGNNYSPAWSVDGRIYFTAQMEGNETICSVKPYRLPAITAPAAPPPEPTVPAGDRRAAVAKDPENEP